MFWISRLPAARLFAGPATRRYGGLTGALLLLYLVYLPLSGYEALYYDARVYWNISAYFHKGGSTSLFSYDNAMRGYVYPLLLYPLHAVHYFTQTAPITLARVQGAVSAAVGFGLIGPVLWQAVAGQPTPPSLTRRGLFALLGFVFWREHFNFTLSDFPALWALLGSLWLLYRPANKLGWTLLAGACLAAATNIRPIYLTAVPCVVGVLLARVPRRQWLPQLLALALGAALVLGPQWVINRRHFGQNTPLVLAQDPNVPPGAMYRAKLWFGLIHQKLETSIDPAYPEPEVFYRDAAGLRLIKTEQPRWFASTAEYGRLFGRHPLLLTRQAAWHLFNGLDVQFASPYVRQVYAATWVLALLNYSIWFAAGLMLLYCPWRRRLRRHQWFTLGALLVPCAFALPLSMECRFLLPLHLLLYALVCFAWPFAGFWRLWARHWALGAAYGLFVALCFAASSRAQATLEYGGRSVWGGRLPAQVMDPMPGRRAPQR